MSSDLATTYNLLMYNIYKFNYMITIAKSLKPKRAESELGCLAIIYYKSAQQLLD